MTVLLTVFQIFACLHSFTLEHCAMSGRNSQVTWLRL